MRIGQGYDVHALVSGRDLYLCGERVEYEKGLLGHSDADVALHALCDALLGASGLGDIGKHFPDTDPKYKGISSIILLKHVCSLIRERGFEIENADITIIAQKPKLLSYIPAMRKNTAEAMGISEELVNVKATTTEKLGFCGRGEGIASMAVVLLK